MQTCPACKKQFDEKQINIGGFCSYACKAKGASVPPPKQVVVYCKICNVRMEVAETSNSAKFKACSLECHQINSNPNKSEAMLHFLFKKKTHTISEFLTDQDLARVSSTSKALHKPAQVAQLGPWYGNHAAKHYDAQRGEVIIPADKMLDIGLQSYTTATKLNMAGKAVILYRVSDRGGLTKGEEQSQTVAGAVKTEENLWPVERTAAWIQGAMRARVPFVLLTDPRGKNALVGGKDKHSDAVYVRELYQVINTHYTVGTTKEGDLPQRLKGKSKTFFKMMPPEKSTGPMPLVPRMSKAMDYDHTWDSSKSSLGLKDDDTTTMAEFVKSTFEDADCADSVSY